MTGMRDKYKRSVLTETKHTELIICGWMESGHVGPRGGLTSGLTTQLSAVSHKAKRERKGPLMRRAHCVALSHIWNRTGPQWIQLTYSTMTATTVQL